jgi:hypothetical protein
MVLAVPMAAVAVPALLTAGCGGSRKGGLSPAQQAAVDQAHTRALAAEQDLIARYDAALALPAVRADQALVDRLTGVRTEHVAHVAALQEGTHPVAVPSGTTSAPPTAGTPDSTSSASAPPMDAKTAVAGLVKAEQDAADRLTADVLATEGHTAQLLASISASESGHAALLLGGTS